MHHSVIAPIGIDVKYRGGPFSGQTAKGKLFIPKDMPIGTTTFHHTVYEYDEQNKIRAIYCGLTRTHQFKATIRFQKMEKY